jgi:hypothetical protein
MIILLIYRNNKTDVICRWDQLISVENAPEKIKSLMSIMKLYISGKISVDTAIIESKLFTCLNPSGDICMD